MPYLNKIYNLSSDTMQRLRYRENVNEKISSFIYLVIRLCWV